LSNAAKRYRVSEKSWSNISLNAILSTKGARPKSWQGGVKPWLACPDAPRHGWQGQSSSQAGRSLGGACGARRGHALAVRAMTKKNPPPVRTGDGREVRLCIMQQLP
jgi:hypothetical protein